MYIGTKVNYVLLLYWGGSRKNLPIGPQNILMRPWLPDGKHNMSLVFKARNNSIRSIIDYIFNFAWIWNQILFHEIKKLEIICNLFVLKRYRPTPNYILNRSTVEIVLSLRDGLAYWYRLHSQFILSDKFIFVSFFVCVLYMI